MNSLRDALVDYLTVRRALGYKLARDEKLLTQFLSHLDTAAGAIAALVGWMRRRHVAAVASVSVEQVSQAAATLAEVVAEQWTKEAGSSGTAKTLTGTRSDDVQPVGQPGEVVAGLASLLADPA